VTGPPSGGPRAQDRQSDHSGHLPDCPQRKPGHRQPAGIPPDKLSSHTVGWWLRRDGRAGWCEEARVALALELVEEARRRIVLERLDGIMQFLTVGATVDQAAARLRRLLTELAA
jgi:hypothetical protein